MQHVNLFVLGAQKCGTTSLADLLNSHPQIFVPSIKETYFFCLDENYEQGTQWYENEFFSTKKAQSATWRADATPFFLASREAIDRIAQYADENARFIVILRDPVKRCVSAYQHMLRLGHETLELESALGKEAERIDKTRSEAGRWWRHAYTEVGKYGAQITYANSVLGKERLLVLRQDELKNRTVVEKKLIEFLALGEDFQMSDEARSNAASMPRIKFIRNILTRPNALKSIARKVFSREFRTKIGVWLARLNSKAVDRIEIDADLEKTLREAFAEDQKILHEMGYSSHLE